MKKSIFLSLLMASCLLVGCGQSDAPPSPIDPPDPIVPTKEEDYISFHYFRTDGNYDDWALWLWEFPSGEGNEYSFNGKDDYGAVADYPLSTFGTNITTLGFIVKSAGSWDSKDVSDDRTVSLKELTIDSNRTYHVYLKSGDKNVYITPDGKLNGNITKCYFMDYSRISVNTNLEMTSVKLFEDDKLLVDKVFSDTNPKIATLNFPEGKMASFEHSYRVEATFSAASNVATSNVSSNSLYKTNQFDEQYTYTGNDLGANYSKNITTFKVWSPVSKSIKVRLYKTASTNEYREYEMTKKDKGIFEYSISEDLEGQYYTFIVNNSNNINKEIVDPYAKSANLNGVRGMIVDFSKTNPEGWESVTQNDYDRKSLVIYETHVSDVTSSSTWNGQEKNRKRFKGMYEEGTTYTKGDVTVKTGFDHIKELGVNAIQLLPVFDQANDETKIDSEFNWGYNPLNYNVIEGKYSSDPNDGYVRIKEFKELVKAYTNSGINVIMDVVYNHVNSAAGSNFDVLMPGYYYRYNSDGAFSNGSGCGNETASEMPMMRKFIIDSTTFLMKEYKLGGFRFDLMGLHDLDTMKLVGEKTKEIFSNSYVCGEPWTGGTSPLESSKQAIQDNSRKFVGYGGFNDQLRDALIKGGLNSATQTGWITNFSNKISDDDVQRIITGVSGKTYLSPTSTNPDPDNVTNYVTCHDNYTLYDRISAAKATTYDSVIARQAMLANSVILTSQATSFLLAGEEMFRTKGGNSNSYNASYKVNELDYSRKVDYIDMFKNYQKLIEFKKTFSGLHKSKDQLKSITVEFSSTHDLFRYTLSDGVNTYLIVHKNGLNTTSTRDFAKDGYSFYYSTIDKTKEITSSTVIKQYETLILVK